MITNNPCTNALIEIFTSAPIDANSQSIYSGTTNNCEIVFSGSQFIKDTALFYRTLSAGYETISD
jgi:hypothetical protein